MFRLLEHPCCLGKSLSGDNFASFSGNSQFSKPCSLFQPAPGWSGWQESDGVLSRKGWMLILISVHAFDEVPWVLLKRPKVILFSCLYLPRIFMVRPWIYITGKFKSIYAKKNRPGAFKNKHYFHPIIQKCIWGGRHFIWAMVFWDLGQ